jgi:hypothetical protein
VSSFLLRLGAEELVAASASSLQGEAGLWAIRAEELNAARVFPMSAKGTTAVIRVRNIITGEDMTWIATESKAMPKEWEGLLQPGEVFVEVSGHAEESNIKALGEEWIPMAGGSSRNVCLTTCQPLLEGNGLVLGGPEFAGAADKSPYRLFWRPE